MKTLAIVFLISFVILVVGAFIWHVKKGDPLSIQ